MHGSRKSIARYVCMARAAVNEVCMRTRTLHATTSGHEFNHYKTYDYP